MMKRLISGNFSSIPMATLLTSTMDIAPEDEIRDDDEIQSEQTAEADSSQS